jgi:hypothetical protein
MWNFLIPRAGIPVEIALKIRTVGSLPACGYSGENGKRTFMLFRVRTAISYRIWGVEAPVWQGAKMQEYSLSFKFSQRSQTG